MADSLSVISLVTQTITASCEPAYHQLRGHRRGASSCRNVGTWSDPPQTSGDGNNFVPYQLLSIQGSITHRVYIGSELNDLVIQALDCELGRNKQRS